MYPKNQNRTNYNAVQSDFSFHTKAPHELFSLKVKAEFNEVEKQILKKNNRKYTFN